MEITKGDMVLYHGSLFRVDRVVGTLGIEVETLDGSYKVGILFSEEFMIACESNRLREFKEPQYEYITSTTSVNGLYTNYRNRINITDDIDF